MKIKPPYLSNGATYCTNGAGGRVCNGSMMGRNNARPADFHTVRKLRLVRVPMSPCGAYDKGGAYWGCSGRGVAPLWCAWGESDTEQAHCFTRAFTRGTAKLNVLCEFPNAKFYR